MLPYNDSNPRDIERYAQGLIGKTFQEVLEESRFLEDAIVDSNIDYTNPNQKGKLGNLLEERYFCYKANSDQEPDFPRCGVELKLTCFERKKNGRLSAGERLVLTMISYEEPVEENFYKSHVWKKCKLILLIYYNRNKKLQSNLLYRICYAKLVCPVKDDIPIIQEDYNKIIRKISMGLAHELSESDTMYLGACTKGATSEGSKVKQYYNPEVLAKKRAFCFKRKYMDYILHTYVIPPHSKYAQLEIEPIVKNPMELQTKSFEDIVIDRLSQYIGASDKALCKHFHRKYDDNKSQWVDLTYRMLGIKGNQAQEFVKANIVVKVIRLKDDYTLEQSVSLPTFKFLKLAYEEWEDSMLFNYLSQTKFFFVVFKRDGDVYRLNRCKFWNMPVRDLDELVRHDWEMIKCHIRMGVTFKIARRKKGDVVKNSLPKKKDTFIVHVRPHTSKAAYRIKMLDGSIYSMGDVEKHANMLPQGDWMTTHSFWLNNSYILHEILS